MEQFKVDTSTARCRVDGVEAKTDRDGRPALDKASGLQTFVAATSICAGTMAPETRSETASLKAVFA